LSYKSIDRLIYYNLIKPVVAFDPDDKKGLSAAFNLTPIFPLKHYSRAISQTDKTFSTDNPLHDEPPALIFLPNLHVFIFVETQQTSTTKAPLALEPPSEAST